MSGEPTRVHDDDGVRRPATSERRSRRRWVPLVAGLLVFLLGVRDIAMVVRPHLWERVKVIDHVLLIVARGVLSRLADLERDRRSRR